MVNVKFLILSEGGFGGHRPPLQPLCLGGFVVLSFAFKVSQGHSRLLKPIKPYSRVSGKKIVYSAPPASTPFCHSVKALCSRWQAPQIPKPFQSVPTLSKPVQGPPPPGGRGGSDFTRPFRCARGWPLAHTRVDVTLPTYYDYPLIRPPATFSPTGGEGRVEGDVSELQTGRSSGAFFVSGRVPSVTSCSRNLRPFCHSVQDLPSTQIKRRARAPMPKIKPRANRYRPKNEFNR
jgi:hypothetical protein